MSVGPYQAIFIASGHYSLGGFFNTRTTSSNLYTNVMSLNLKSHLLGPMYVPAWVEKKPICFQLQQNCICSQQASNNLVGGGVPLFFIFYLLQTRLTIKLFAKRVKPRSKTLGFNEIEDGSQNAR